MGKKKRPTKLVGSVSVFDWNEKTSLAATLLAQGFTNLEVAAEVGVSDRTINRWNQDVEFSSEVDRLSLMLGIAARAERLRMAQRVARQKSSAGLIETDKDLLDWLKFAQSETDGIKLDLAALSAAFGEDAASLADERPDGYSEGETTCPPYVH